MSQVVRLRRDAAFGSVRPGLADSDRKSLARTAEFLRAAGRTEMAERVVDVLYYLLDAELTEARVLAFPSTGRDGNRDRDPG